MEDVLIGTLDLGEKIGQSIQIFIFESNTILDTTNAI